MQRLPWPYPSPTFAESLPITAHLSEIQTALEKNQVIVVAGETGSGKTTQLPKLMLAMGRGVTGHIGHTQPRRIAARSVATRVAEELSVTLGNEVGYQIRFQQHVNDSSYIKVMTDGILLAELTQDRLLKKYDTLIIDEAHERSLNIDFILGYLKWLLPERPDLKIIITSATLDHQRFSAHFNNCPVIEVSGRGFPVEIIYQPLLLDGGQVQDLAQMQGILQAIQSFDNPQGDVLVFLSGERDIRQAAEFLRKATLKHSEILPLYAKLTAAEQQKIFHPGNLRRIILATNIAETSLTIPNICYVIDSGNARIKRYSSRSKIQHLPIEAISKASAKQRAGRCGRTSAGVCIRLYSQDDFLLREEFTQPEILRSNLANVILQMLALKLGSVEEFPWLDAPETQYWRDAYQCLEELQAIVRDKNNCYQLTSIGKFLAKIPLDPRLGRMLISASEKNCLTELLIVVSALSVPDIFLRPLDQRQAADEKHRLFADPSSDFLTYLNLWIVLHRKQHELSNNQFRKFCDRYFLSYLKFKEWQDLQQELKNLSANIFKKINEIKVAQENEEIFSPSLKLFPKDSAEWILIHQSLLSGLLTNVAQKQEQGTYLATRLRSVKLFPGSALFKKSPAWLMALEFVETKQVYARTLAVIDPIWIESLAPQLIKKSYSEPHWNQKRGEVMAFEKVLFFGLAIIEKRQIRYASIDPALAHDIFLREALALRQLNSTLKFWRHNENFLIELEKLEEMTRSRHFVPDEHWLYAFYRGKIPREICSQIELEKWWRHLDDEMQNDLFLTEKHLEQLNHKNQKEDYPTEFIWQENKLKIAYQFSPGSAEDGVSLLLPLPLLQQLPEKPFDWLVPGLLEKKIHAILKGLPKELRQILTPIQDAANLCFHHLEINVEKDFFVCLAEIIQQQFSENVDPHILRQIVVPDFLKFNFIIISDGKTLAMGRSLLALKKQFCAEELDATSEEISMLYTDWPVEVLAKEIQIKQKNLTLVKYQALQAQADGVCIVAIDSLMIAQQIHRVGVAKLLQLKCHEQLTYTVKKLLMPAVCAAGGNSKLNKVWPYFEQDFSSWSDFSNYFCYALINMTFAEDFWEMRSAKDFAQCIKTHEKDLLENAQMFVVVIQSMLKQMMKIYRAKYPVDLSDLFFPSFLAVVPLQWLERYPFYLAALAECLEKNSDSLLSRLHAYEEIKCNYESVFKEMVQALALPGDLMFEVAFDPPVFFYPLYCLSENFLHAYYLLQEFKMTLLSSAFKPIESVSAVRLQKFICGLGV